MTERGLTPVPMAAERELTGEYITDAVGPTADAIPGFRRGYLITQRVLKDLGR